MQCASLGDYISQDALIWIHHPRTYLGPSLRRATCVSVRWKLRSGSRRIQWDIVVCFDAAGMTVLTKRCASPPVTKISMLTRHSQLFRRYSAGHEQRRLLAQPFMSMNTKAHCRAACICLSHIFMCHADFNPGVRCQMGHSCRRRRMRRVPPCADHCRPNS